jgi:hypothetical protein
MEWAERLELNAGTFRFTAQDIKMLVDRIRILENKIARLYQIWGVEPDGDDSVVGMIDAHDEVMGHDTTWEVQDDNDLSVPDNESG